MAILTAPRCEIRDLVMHVYPDGIKAGRGLLAGFSSDERRLMLPSTGHSS